MSTNHLNDSDFWRVKLYQLENGGAWHDQGTGFVTCQHAPPSNGYHSSIFQSYETCLVVRREEDNSIFLQSPIQEQENYERQGDCIIMWREVCAESGDVDYALSFQEAIGCHKIWETILGVQSLNSSRSAHLVSEPEMEDSQSPPTENISSTFLKLPDVTADNLTDIKEKLDIAFAAQKEIFASIIVEHDGAYIKQLLTLSEIRRRSDDEASVRCCNRIAEILKSIVYLNDASVLDLVLGQEAQEEGEERVDAQAQGEGAEDLFPSFCAAMDYDPLLRDKGDFGRQARVSPLRLSAIIGHDFREIASIRPLVVKLFRLKFLKERIMRPLLDELGASCMNTKLLQLHAVVCAKMFDDHATIAHTLQAVIDLPLADPADPTPAKGFLALRFLRELFFLSKPISLDQKHGMVQRLMTAVSTQLFSALTHVLSHTQQSTSAARCLAAELFATVAQVCPNSVHKQVLGGPVPPLPVRHNTAQAQAQAQQSMAAIGEGPAPPRTTACFLRVVIERICCDQDQNVVELLADALHTLLEPDRIDKTDRERFLGVFYDYYMPWLLVPFSDEDRSPDQPYELRTEPGQTQTMNHNHHHNHSLSHNQCQQDSRERPLLQSSFVVASSRRCICELLVLCVQGHAHRMKYFVMRNAVVSRVLRLMRSTHRHLRLCAIKFLRAVVGSKDDFYYRHIVKNDLFKSVVEELGRNRRKDNLITSAITELVEFIRSEGISTLIKYLVDKYRSELWSEEEGDLVWDKLLVRYDQLVDAEQNSNGRWDEKEGQGATKSRRHDGPDDRRGDEEEENYFQTDSDEGEMLTQSHPPHGDHHQQQVRNIHVESVASRQGKSYFLDNIPAGVGRQSSMGSPSGSPSNSSSGSSESSSFSQPSKSSLDMIADLYGDMDEDQGDEANQANQGDHNHPHGGIDHLDDDPPPLPPLRPKFGSSDVAEEEGRGFFSNKMVNGSSSAQCSSPGSSSKEGEGASAGTTSSSTHNNTNTSNAFSFSLKKRRKI